MFASQFLAHSNAVRYYNELKDKSYANFKKVCVFVHVWSMWQMNWNLILCFFRVCAQYCFLNNQEQMIFYAPVDFKNKSFFFFFTNSNSNIILHKVSAIGFFSSTVFYVTVMLSGYRTFGGACQVCNC
jgi:hypothetical protein